MNVGYTVGAISAQGDLQGTTKLLGPHPRREDIGQAIKANGANNLCLGKSHPGRFALKFPWETSVVCIHITFCSART